MPRLCRECRDGKHVNCDGVAWNEEIDAPDTCQCSDEFHG